MNFIQSNMFNADWYLGQNPDVAAAVRAGRMSAHDHFVRYGMSEGRSPLSLFDANFYLTQNPDVAAAVGAGIMSAVEHFLMFGQAEARVINPFIDLGAYMNANPDIAAAAQDGMSLMGHLLQFGAAENRDLGNGVSLAVFRTDPEFRAAIASGLFEAALSRVGEVAPFLPGFVPPPGWAPPADTPIPADFTPPAGLQLIIPPSVTVPPGMPLPPVFRPVDRPATPPAPSPIVVDEDWTPPPPPNFTVFEIEEDSGVYGFGGTATGDITFSITFARGDEADVTFTRGGQSVTIQNYSTAAENYLSLSAGQTLTGTAADIAALANLNVGIMGDGTVAVSAYNNDNGDDDTDLLSVGTALITIHITGEVSLLAPPSLADSHRYTVADGATLSLFANMLAPGTTVAGAGDVRVTLLDGHDGDFSAISVDGTVFAVVQDELDITAYASVEPIAAFEVDVLANLRLTAAQAHGREIFGAGQTVIVGSEGSQLIRVLTLGPNTIAGGPGGDRIILPEDRDDTPSENEVLVNLDAGRGYMADSYWSPEGGTWDIIENFSVGDGDTLKLKIPGAVIEEEVGNGDDVPDADVASLIALIAANMGDEARTAAFSFQGSTYIFQNLDDNAEITDTDIFIQLSGVTLDSLTDAIS